MSAVKPAGTVPGDQLSSADQAQVTVNLLEDFAEEGQQLRDTQLAVLNILEDSTTDRLRAEAAVKASLNILEDLSQAQAEIRTLNAELEARVEQRTAELVVANKNLEAFTYSVAHDLRSPLRALSGYSEALVEDYGDRLDEAGLGFVERIQAASERMSALIDDLLLLARVSRAEMSLGPVDLSAEVADIAAELQAREPGRRVRFATLKPGVMSSLWVLTTSSTSLRPVESVACRKTQATSVRLLRAAGTACGLEGRTRCMNIEQAGLQPPHCNWASWGSRLWPRTVNIVFGSALGMVSTR